MVILPGSAPSLLGGNWLQVLKLNWGQLFHIDDEDNDARSGQRTSKELDDILRKYEALFCKGMKTLKDTSAHIELKEGATPHYYKPRPVPYSLKGRIDRELDRLVDEGILQPVERSQWAAPIVPIVVIMVILEYVGTIK